MSTLVDSYLPPSMPTNEVGLRLALVHDGRIDHATLMALLTAGGVPPNAAVLPSRRRGELVMSDPDAIIVAADLCYREGLVAVRSLRRQTPTTPIVVVSPDPQDALTRQALNAGADAFVPERLAADALAPAVRAVAAGLVCVPRIAQRVVVKPTFSHREKEVLDLLVGGLTNAQIATRLYVAESTVKTHLASAFAKLGVRSRKDAIAVLLDPAEGLVSIALPPASGSTVRPPQPLRPRFHRL